MQRSDAVRGLGARDETDRPGSSVVGLLSSPANLCARTGYVKVDRTGDAPTIQVAIDSAKAGDDVLVAAGTYSWSSEGAAGESMIRLKPDIWLHAESGAISTILDAQLRGRVIECADVGDRAIMPGAGLARASDQMVAPHCGLTDAKMTRAKKATMKPPSEIPPDLFDQFTMQRQISVEYRYQDDSACDGHPKIYKKEMIDAYFPQIKQKTTFYYGTTDTYLYKALGRYSIAGKTVAIMGSQSPLYESICLFYGGSPTTIEYQKIVSEDNRLKTMTVEEYGENPVSFDAAFSISSFEHDGLGRYGDPINPDADLQAMARMRSIIKPGGILFLSVPAGREDRLLWNVHRTYGKLRLPKLLLGWKILNIYGWGTWQPVFVLKNSSGRGYLNYALRIFGMSYVVRPFVGKIKRWLKPAKTTHSVGSSSFSKRAMW